jgi:peptide/nickel transport system substrate-binding protein
MKIMLSLALLATMSAVQAQPALTIATGGAFSSMDPHFHDLSPNHALTQHVFETLVATDPDGRPIPNLALSWEATTPTSWEIRLRPGVTFHDGTPFTADDVVFTHARAPTVPGSPASMGQYIRPVTRIEVMDPHTLRFHTSRPVPLMPMMMSTYAIVSRRHGEGAETRDYNQGRAAIGTGPYRFATYTPGDRATFTGNPNHWAGPAAFSRVTIRMIPSDTARVAALRAGDVDAIDNVPTRDVAQLRGVPGITVQSRVGQRLIYLYVDVGRERTPHVTDNRGNPIPNPLRDVRVRRALSQAINREGISRQLMEGFSVPAGQLMPEGALGHDPGIAPDRFDPTAARRLLTEAGYPDGFMMTLHGPNDRYVNDAEIAQALAQMWARIGVRVNVATMPSSMFFARTPRDENSISLTGWSSSTGEADTSLINMIATPSPERGWGTYLRASHYTNPETDGLLERALATIDTQHRGALYQQIIRIGVQRDLGVIPIHHQVNVWATRSHVRYAPTIWERTRAMEFSPVQ